MRVDQAKSANTLIDQPALKDYMKRMELIKEATENWMKIPSTRTHRSCCVKQ